MGAIHERTLFHSSVNDVAGGDGLLLGLREEGDEFVTVRERYVAGCHTMQRQSPCQQIEINIAAGMRDYCWENDFHLMTCKSLNRCQHY